MAEPRMPRSKLLELVRGSGNVFRDFGMPSADLEQAKAILAAKILAMMDARQLTARAAAALTGVSHTDFSRIRNVKLDRFTLDRLITIIGKLDRDIEISVDVRQRQREETRPIG